MQGRQCDCFRQPRKQDGEITQGTHSVTEEITNTLNNATDLVPLFFPKPRSYILFLHIFFFFWLTRKDSKVKAVFNKLFDYTSQILD